MWLGADPTQWCFQKLASVGLISHPVGGDECESLANLEAVLIDGAQDGVLLLAR